jgi:hypothetical protein
MKNPNGPAPRKHHGMIIAINKHQCGIAKKIINLSPAVKTRNIRLRITRYDWPGSNQYF